MDDDAHLYGVAATFCFHLGLDSESFFDEVLASSLDVESKMSLATLLEECYHQQKLATALHQKPNWLPDYLSYCHVCIVCKECQCRQRSNQGAPVESVRFGKAVTYLRHYLLQSGWRFEVSLTACTV